MRYCFYPREQLTVERQKQYSIGKVQRVLSAILTQASRNGNRTRGTGNVHQRLTARPKGTAACGGLNPYF
jgi:hypothetical protein